MSVKLYLKVRNSEFVQKLSSAMKSRDGGVIAENGLLIAGVAAVVVVVILLINTFAKDTFIPAPQDKLMEIFSLS